MAYTIRYGPTKPNNKRPRIFLTLFFFLLFILFANAFFSEYLSALRALVFPQNLQDAVTAVWQELLTGADAYAN